MELGRLTNRSRKKRVIRFRNEEVKVGYQEALEAEVHSFSDSTKNKVQNDMS